jgi:GNAT superfamily N-acetyltransferase
MAQMKVRGLEGGDYAGWRTLWDGYNAFYGRSGAKALPEAVTQTLWSRLNQPDAPVRALVATDGETLSGLAHLVFHLSTSAAGEVCYVQDLYVADGARRGGVGRALMTAAYEAAQARGCGRVYWHTQETNRVARRLYDQIARRTGFIVYRKEW